MRSAVQSGGNRTRDDQSYGKIRFRKVDKIKLTVKKTRQGHSKHASLKVSGLVAVCLLGGVLRKRPVDDQNGPSIWALTSSCFHSPGYFVAEKLLNLFIQTCFLFVNHICKIMLYSLAYVRTSARADPILGVTTRQLVYKMMSSTLIAYQIYEGKLF